MLDIRLRSCSSFVIPFAVITTSTDNAARNVRSGGFRRWFQFSLRGVLLLFVVVSIGLWYWWYWPLESQVVIDSHSISPPPAHLNDWFDEDAINSVSDPFWVALPHDPFGDDDRYFRREMRTLRRQGFTGTLRHGLTLAYNQSGRQVFEENWHDGRLHGPYRMWNAAGQLIVNGQFDRGKQHGAWTFWNSQGQRTEVRSYAAGIPDGLWTQYSTVPDGQKSTETRYRQGKIVNAVWYAHVTHAGEPQSVHTWTVDYDDGKPVRMNGKPIDEFTERFARAPDWVHRLFDRQSLAPGDSSLRSHGDLTLEVLVFALCGRELFELPVRIEFGALQRDEFDIEQRFSVQAAQAPLRICLAATLRRLGLVCDYRFDQLVITTREDAETWTDRTGINELHPPPGSPWALRLEAKSGVEFLDVRALFSDGAEASEPAVIRISPGLIDPNSTDSVGFNIHTPRMPFRFWLHRLLGREGLTCELDGDTLLIKPLED